MPKKPTYRLTDSCRTLTLDKFVECLFNKRLEVLIEKGTKVPREVLVNQWDAIWSEYIELQEDDSLTMMVATLKDYNYNRAALASVEIALYVLEIGYNEECANNLRKFGLAYNFETEDKDKYREYLNACKIRSKGFYISAERAKQAYLDLTNTTRERAMRLTDFDEVLAHTAKFMGYQIKPQETTVTQFIAMRKLMRK